jgi:hypothetical protein
MDLFYSEAPGDGTFTLGEHFMLKLSLLNYKRFAPQEKSIIYS